MKIEIDVDMDKVYDVSRILVGMEQGGMINSFSQGEKECTSKNCVHKK